MQVISLQVYRIREFSRSQTSERNLEKNEEKILKQRDTLMSARREIIWSQHSRPGRSVYVHTS